MQPVIARSILSATLTSIILSMYASVVHADDLPFKPWLVRAGVSLIVPKSDNGSLLNNTADITIDNRAGPTVTLSYFFSPHWAVDILGGLPFKHQINVNGSQAGEAKHRLGVHYGGSYNLFAYTLPKQGIQVRFFDYRDPAALEALIDDKTKLVFAESIGNPLGNIVDIQAISDIAHRHGVPVVVDNTVATPILHRPFEHGADIVVHSLTKYIGGHGNSIGGINVDSGKFPWGEHKARFPSLNTPDPSYQGVNYVEALGAAAYIARARVVPLRNTGAALSPFNTFLILQGLETLALRIERHSDNALKVAEYLRQQPKVKWVKYAGLSDHPEHALVHRYLSGKASGILSFGVQGGKEGGTRFIDALQLITRLVNIGDVKSLACHPATTTHRQLNAEELLKAGVSEDMVRISVGIEHIDDIIADLEQALAKV